MYQMAMKHQNFASPGLQIDIQIAIFCIQINHLATLLVHFVVIGYVFSFWNVVPRNIRQPCIVSYALHTVHMKYFWTNLATN
jgi:hypothetical protein